MVNVFLLRCIQKKNRADIPTRDQAVSHTTPIFLSILRAEGVMDAGRVEMTSSPFVGTSAVHTVGSSGPPDMESIRGIEVTSLSTGRRATEAAGLWILRL